MAELVIGTVATPQPWRRELQAHVRDHVAGVRLVTLHDTREAIAADVDVVVVDDTLDFLTEADARALHANGTRVVGMYDPSGRHGRGRRPLDDLRIETALPITVGPDALLETVATLAPGRRDRLDGGVVAVGTAEKAQDPGGQGSVTVVSGGSDAPGRTEIAVALSHALAHQHGPGSVVLVDLDVANPTVARRLGFQLTPNVLDASRLAHGGRPLDDALARRAAFAPDTSSIGFDVITGMAGPADVDALGALLGLIGAVATHWAQVVLDVGSIHESSPRRASSPGDPIVRSALQRADHVVAVAGATPLGVLRLLDWAAAAARPAPTPRDASAPMPASGSSRWTVAVNRAPKDRFRRAELHDQVTENLPDGRVEEIQFIPEDRRVASAVWEAAPVGRGRFTAEVTRLARRIAEPAAAHSGSRASSKAPANGESATPMAARVSNNGHRGAWPVRRRG